MGEIDNFNCEGLCQEQFCNKKYTHILWVTITGMKICLLFCEAHHEKLELNLIDKRIEVVDGT